MVNREMRDYYYYTYGNPNSYGEPVLSAKSLTTIPMAIYLLTKDVGNTNAMYEKSTYVGLTNAAITDKYVIEYGTQKLKVLYVNPAGHFKQVFMVGID